MTLGTQRSYDDDDDDDDDDDGDNSSGKLEELGDALFLCQV